MKRSKPLARKTPMKRSTKPLQRTRLKPMSEKRKADLVTYHSLCQRRAEEYPICEFAGCTRKRQETHHKARRGKHYLTYEYLMSVCREHHTWIENNGKEAERLGYLIRTKPGA